METRANYALIGVFTLATIAAAFGFVYWFTNVSGGGARATYQVEFGAPVSGLRGGSAVTFNGIRVGEVVRIALAADNPRQVMATIRVDSAAPVRADTSAILEFQGLTGLATLALRGGSPSAGRPRVGGDGYPILNADLSQTQDVTEAARAVMRRLESLIAETEAPMKTTMRNIEAFTGTLARNSDRFERILAGVEKLSGGPDQQGEIAEAIAAVKALTESGGRDWHALTVDGRRAMGTIEQVFRNLDRNPQRLLFGNSSSSGPRR